MRVFTEMKWGTKEAVPFKDKELKMIRLRAFGNFSTRITDPQLFINTIVGSRSLYTTEAIEDFLRGLIVNRFNDILGETIDTILELARYYDELSAALKARVKDDYGKYGIELVDFFIDAITPPEEVQKMIDERAGMAAVGNMNEFAQFQAAKAMRDLGRGLAEGGGGGGGTQGAGLGAGIGMGMMLPQMVMQNMYQQQQAKGGAPEGGQPKIIPCPACHSLNFEGAKFCSNCGAKLLEENNCPHCNHPLQRGAKFCNDCGKAVQVAEPIKCPKCHSNIPPGSKFCSSCGTEIKS
jgi:membrane protease subunit (stomatin/prohibitin family)